MFLQALSSSWLTINTVNPFLPIPKNYLHPAELGEQGYTTRGRPEGAPQTTASYCHKPVELQWPGELPALAPESKPAPLPRTRGGEGKDPDEDGGNPEKNYLAQGRFLATSVVSSGEGGSGHGFSL